MMKIHRRNKYKFSLWALVVCLFNYGYCLGQDSTKHDLVANISYFMTGNKIIYLMVNAKTKINSKFQPVENSSINLYLDSIGDNHFIAKVTTDETGRAKAILPPALKEAWDASADHTFLGISEANKEFDETTVETSITKTKINIDTSSDGEARNIIVTVSALKNGGWIPAKDVDLKVGIRRLGGILSAGDDDIYTTDSTGSVTVELKRDSLPGDEKRNILLAAKVEDNDQYGNLLVQKSVPWGKAFISNNNFFDQRTLWTTRSKTPIWLRFMAYSIVIGVWGTLIYLVFQLIRIKKLTSKEN